MSGICAVWDHRNCNTSQKLNRIVDGLTISTVERAHIRADREIGVGVAARFNTQQVYETPRLLVACDAELFNTDELLRAVGDSHRIAEENQTPAVIAALYERFGPQFVDRLRGAFSIVVCDRRERTLLAAIDGFGIKRLVYHHGQNCLEIASRVDALARCGNDWKVNPRAIANYLNFGSGLAPETIFTEVRRMLPGTMIIVAEGKLSVKQYWDMSYDPGDDIDEDRLSRTLESTVERAVAVQCKNDPFSSLGAFLSGGTDSSTVVGMMSRMGGGPAKSFSIGFQEQEFNELGYAQIAAERFQSDHHTYLVSASDCMQAIPMLIRAFDEPFGNSSAVPTYFCAKLAADEGVQVLLAGDGGDELFGGNERYLTDKVLAAYQSVPGWFRKGLMEPGLRLMPFETALIKRARSYISRSNLPPVERFFSWHFLRSHDPRTIFSADLLAELGTYSVLDIPSGYYLNGPARDHLDRLLYVDVKITLADSDLPKVTGASELAGIQPRFPFLDRAVAELSGRIPSGLKVKGREKRYLFKRAFRKLLPLEIIQKKKHGFGIPVATWMKKDPGMRELTYDTLLSNRAFRRGYFQRNTIEELFRMHEATDDSPYYGDMLWAFLALELWHERVVDEAEKVAP